MDDQQAGKPRDKRKNRRIKQIPSEQEQDRVERCLDIPDDAVIRARDRMNGRNKHRIDRSKVCIRATGGDGIAFPRKKIHSKKMVVQLVPLGWFGKPVNCGQSYENGHQEQKDKPQE